MILVVWYRFFSLAVMLTKAFAVAIAAVRSCESTTVVADTSSKCFCYCSSMMIAIIAQENLN